MVTGGQGCRIPLHPLKHGRLMARGGGQGLKHYLPRTLVNSGVAIGRSLAKPTPGAQDIVVRRIDPSQLSSSKILCALMERDGVPTGYKMYMKKADSLANEWDSRSSRARTARKTVPRTKGECVWEPKFHQNTTLPVRGNVGLPIFKSSYKTRNAAALAEQKRTDEPKSRNR